MQAEGFGERLRLLMQRRDLTVNRLGRLMGHEDGSTVSRYRSGKHLPTLDSLAELVNGAGLSRAETIWLLGISPDHESPDGATSAGGISGSVESDAAKLTVA